MRPPAGAASAFIGPDLNLNGVQKSGYLVSIGPGAGAADTTLAANTCNASGANAVSGYFGEAHPVTVGGSGQRSVRH